MRYIGNKLNLLDFIYSIAKEHDLTDGVFCDIFSGTANVAKHFKKKGFEVISNDFMTYSYAFQRAYIQNNEMPRFEELEGVIRRPKLSQVIDHLNVQKGKKGFMFRNYCMEGTTNSLYRRNYFSSLNAGKIDAIRDRLDIWRQDGSVTDDEFYILLAALLEAIPYVSNIAGTYGAFLKKNDPRMKKPLTLPIPEIIKSDKENYSYQEDSNYLIRKVSCDILYVDPPYNKRQYAPNYHILESVAVWDKRITPTVTGLRPWANQKSRYSSEDECMSAFEDLVMNARCKHILFSYNTEGVMSDRNIVRILSKKGDVTSHNKNYRRYKSHAKEKNKGVLKELLYYVDCS